MEATLQSILTAHFEAYRSAHPLPLHKLTAARAIINCRTAAMGGHVVRCPHGHVEEVHYNSCKNRSCPQCSGLPTERWLDKVNAQLLACDHYHVIFTLPHQLIGLWWLNPRLMADILFACAVATLRELLDDPRYLGAQVGIIASLHTWGRDIGRHPHLHILITGGGWKDGAWVPVTNGYLLPFQVVRKLFAGKIIAALRQAYTDGQLQLTDALTPDGFDRLLARLWYKVKWNVHLRERYPHGKGVATYIARYIKGGPISNRQIIYADDTKIVLSYTDHRDHKRKTRTFTPEQFIAAILDHIPESGQHVVRYYGLYHPSNKARAQCRTHFGQPPEEKPAELDWQTYLERLGQPEKATCPVCGAHLISISYTAPKIPNAVPQKPIAAHQQGPPWQLPLHLPLPAAA